MVFRLGGTSKMCRKRCSMALTGLVNLTESLLNQTQAQQLGTQGPPQTQTTGSAVAQAAQEDQFSPSAQNDPAQGAAQAAQEDQFTPSAQNDPLQGAAQAAGLFSVGQTALLSAAGELLLAHAALAQGSPANTPPPVASLATSPTTVTTATNAVAGLQTPAAVATPPALAASANANNGIGAAPLAQPAAASATPNAPAANVQDQLQALNNSLASLGLTAADIQQLDQIASLTNDFNPAAFASLAYQLELSAQAQNPSPQTAPAPPAHTAAAPAAGGSTSAAGNGPTLPVQAPQQAANSNPPSGVALAPAQIKATA
jgi:hypothetical protein